jgi:ATP-dependent DNA helicase RecQ
MEQNYVTIDQALERFGLNSFRPGQREVIEAISTGSDCLCVMPTGGGKSLCYQLPSLIRPGLTIVVSPLIALMKDQVDSLGRNGIPAALINSTLSHSEQQTRLQDVAAGKYQLVYVAPERLRNPRFLEAIRATPIQLLAIDEAHCISQWGHDFRPDYTRIGQFREWLGGVQTVALTATATPRVRQDIMDVLGLKKPRQFMSGFARPNLHFGVINCQSDREKEEELGKFLKSNPGAGIIYAATRKRCEALVDWIGQTLKIPVGAYHAGLQQEQRRVIQERFMSNQLRLIVATNAFGMGIDKSDLRFVIHYNMPGSLEAYYQEAGRAGRDGKDSVCVMLYSMQDRYIQEYFIENNYPPRDVIQSVYEFLQSREEDPIELTLEEIRDQMGTSVTPEAIGSCLQILSRTRVLERFEAGGGLALVRINSDLPTLVNLFPP